MLTEQMKIRLWAAESELIVLRDPTAAGYAYLRESWLPMGPRNKLNKYNGYAWSEIVAYIRPDFEVLSKFDKERRVRIFWLDHRCYPNRLDGHDPFRPDQYGGVAVSLAMLAPGRPSVPPVGAYVVKAAQRAEALKHAAEMHDYWSRWAQSNGVKPSEAPSEQTAGKPKQGFLAWLRGK